MARQALQDGVPAAGAPLPAVPDLLRRVRHAGLRIAVASSAKRDELEIYLDIAGIADLVDVTTCSDDVKESKPAPDIFEAVLKKLGIEGADAVAIGDTPYDAEAAGKAKIATVGVLCGGFTENSLRQAGCVQVYPGPAALLACFGNRSSQNRPMARKLKTYQTSLGFFDQAIAAPSMKAALEAWGADSNLFHQGAARESDDPDVVAATMAKPGVVLKRPVGSTGPFREHAELPAKLGGGGENRRRLTQAGRPETEEGCRPPRRRGGGAQGRPRLRTGAEEPRARTGKGRGRSGRRNASAASRPSTRRRPH